MKPGCNSSRRLELEFASLVPAEPDAELWIRLGSPARSAGRFNPITSEEVGIGKSDVRKKDQRVGGLRRIEVLACSIAVALSPIQARTIELNRTQAPKRD